MAMTGSTTAIKRVSGPISGINIAKSLTKAISTTPTNQSTDSTKTSDDTTEIGKDKDDKKPETQTPKTDAQKQAEQDAAIKAAIGGHSIPGFPATKEETAKLQEALKTNPGQFAGIDANPVSGTSLSNPYPASTSTNPNTPGANSNSTPQVTNNWIGMPNCSTCHHDHHKNAHDHGTGHNTSVVCNDKPSTKPAQERDDTLLAKGDSPKEPPPKAVEDAKKESGHDSVDSSTVA